MYKLMIIDDAPVRQWLKSNIDWEHLPVELVCEAADSDTASASVVYEGVRCQYGQKSSTYDRANYYNNGKIIGSYTQAGQPIVGGTVIPLASDGSLLTPYICYATIEPENNT